MAALCAPTYRRMGLPSVNVLRIRLDGYARWLRNLSQGTMFVDSRPDGLVLNDDEEGGRLVRSASLGRLLAIVVVLVVAAMSTGFLGALM